MAQFVVRNLEDTVKDCLQRRARAKGHSMEEEVRDILRNAVKEPQSSSVGLGTEIAAFTRGKRLKFDVQELRGHPVKPVMFDE